MTIFVLLVARFSPAALITVEGDCTIQDAIEAANTDAAQGDCPAGGGGPDDIRLTTSVLLDEVDNETWGPTGLPVISTKITIDGSGFIVARNPAGAPLFRILAVGPSGEPTLENVAVTFGLGRR